MVDASAHIDPTADIGPYVTIVGPVRIGAGTCVMPHVFIGGWTEIGKDCTIHSFVSLGDKPQDRAYRNGESYCRIGDRVDLREGVTVHRGTDEGSSTLVGDDALLMGNSHVGHNSSLAEHVILANGAVLGGHVTVGRAAFISGNVAVHQYVRIGELAMIGLRWPFTTSEDAGAHGEQRLLKRGNHPPTPLCRIEAACTPEEMIRA